MLFIVSEILPVTILFLTVILFDIKLTTGSLNGFLFFMQVFSTLHITNNIIGVPTTTKPLLTVLNSIAKVSNLNFFVIPSLEFCLFKGSNSLDLLTIDYVTVVYSLVLVILTVLCLNRRCNQHMKRLRGKHTLPTTSIIHGLSGFLVLCYAKTTIVTLKILTPGFARGRGRKYYETVAFYQGNLLFFHSRHLKYAVPAPALFALVFITSLPPLLLLVYPLCYKVLALLRLEETKFTQILCKILPLEKFKPLFDSFQGDFRDNHRYFAGLYFVYRLAILALYAFTNNYTEFYFCVQLLLTFMCILHGWIQPYKKTWHNILYLYLFTLMTVINGITLYNFIQTNDHKKALAVCTTVLAYSPLVFMVAYILKKLQTKRLINYIIRKIKKRKEEDIAALSLSMLDEGRSEVSDVGYEKLDHNITK